MRSYPALEARRRLGEELRQARHAAGATTRQVPGYTSGHISSVENGRTQPSTDLVEMYARTFGGDRVSLYALYQAAVAESNRLRNAQRRGHTAPEPDAQDGNPSPSAIKRTYITESRDSTFSFNPQGVVDEVRVVHAISARAPQTRLFYAGHTYEADRRRGVLTAEAGQGCQIERIRESDTGSIRLDILLDKEINPGDSEPYVFSYRVLVESSIRTRPYLLYQPGSATVLRYTVRAQFRPPTLPTQIWWFATETDTEADFTPLGERVFRPDIAGYYVKEFRSLINGWCYGLGWQWPPA